MTKYREDSRVSTDGWSSWVRAIIPKLPDHGKMNRWYEERKGNGYICTHIRDAFDDNHCGIYEWKAVHDKGRDYVVYIGSTCRNKPGALESRILEYCSNGSHKKTVINKALKNGYEMWVRVKEIGELEHEEDAEKAENEMLEAYNYSWNKRENKPYRGASVPPAKRKRK